MERRNYLRAVLVVGLVGGAVGGLGCTEEPSPTPTPPQRPSNRLIVSTPTTQGLEGVTFPSTSTVESKPELPPGWEFYKSEDLRYRIAIPSSWVPLPASGPIKVNDKFLGEVVDNHQNSLDVSVWRARLFNDKGEWNTFEDYVTEESQMADYLIRVSSKREEEVVNKGYWPRLVDGSRAWFVEMYIPSERKLYIRLMFIKYGRLWNISYSVRHESEGSHDGYLRARRIFETAADSFKSP